MRFALPSIIAALLTALPAGAEGYRVTVTGVVACNGVVNIDDIVVAVLNFGDVCLNGEKARRHGGTEGRAVL